MKIVGLTGSIGMGKSTVAAMLRDLGIPVFDADAEVHVLQGPSGRLVPEIEAAFPGSTGPYGVDRTALGTRIFGDDAAMRRIEAIVHPAVAEERAKFLTRHADAPLVVFDIPLLLERGRPAGLHALIVVSASAILQRERVLQRPGMSHQKFEAILARQLPDADKRAAADFIIDTGTTLDETRVRVAEVFTCLLADAR